MFQDHGYEAAWIKAPLGLFTQSNFCWFWKSVFAYTEKKNDLLTLLPQKWSLEIGLYERLRPILGTYNRIRETESC